MGAAIIGLVGAMLGALTALLGATLTDRRQTRREEAKWRRDQRSAAYDGALRHLLRAANIRSEFRGGGGMAVLRQEHQREWFDDLVHAQFWLHQLIRYCDRSQLDNLQAAAKRLDVHIARLISAERYDQKGFSILEILQGCIATVTASARADNGGDLPAVEVASQPPPAIPTEPSPDRHSQIVMASDAGTADDQH
jgi:hypothetical protein